MAAVTSGEANVYPLFFTRVQHTKTRKKKAHWVVSGMGAHSDAVFLFVSCSQNILSIFPLIIAICIKARVLVYVKVVYFHFPFRWLFSHSSLLPNAPLQCVICVCLIGFDYSEMKLTVQPLGRA